tara:strand:+ start:9132 stop:9977 length:846 start_codon:yes stop_codon:yes gene_type:complete
MKNVVLILLLIPCFSSAQDIQSSLYTPLNQEGNLSIYFGWNRSAYSLSSISFEGADYNFTLNDLKALDKQTEFSFENYFRLDNITIPQTNMGVTYNINDKVALSLNVDHMKYKVIRNQATTIDGTINGDYDVWNGNYNNEQIIMTNNLLKLEHTDGLNYVNVGYSRNLIEKNQFKTIALSTDLGGSIGFMLPKTNSEILGKDRHDEFHLSGFGLGIHSGLKIHIGKPLFLNLNAKGGFINMPNIRTTANKQDSASQHFFYLQGNFLFGFTINTKNIKKPSK